MTIYKVNTTIVKQVQQISEGSSKEIAKLPSAIMLFEALGNLHCDVPTISGSVKVLKNEWQTLKNIRKQIFEEITEKLSNPATNDFTHTMSYMFLKNLLENVRVKNEPSSETASLKQNSLIVKDATIKTLEEVKALFPEKTDELSAKQVNMENQFAKVFQGIDDLPKVYAPVHVQENSVTDIQPAEYKPEPVYNNVSQSITRNLFIAGGTITGAGVLGTVLLGIFFPPLLALGISFIISGLIILLAALIRAKLQMNVQ